MTLPSDTMIATFQGDKPVTVSLADLASAIGVPTAEQMAFLAIAADSAIGQLEALADDGVLTGSEKQTKLIPLDSELEAIWQALDSRASAVATDVAVQPARDVAAAARGAWQAYRNALTPAWDDTTTDTPVDRTTFDSRLEDYRLALTRLTDALRQAASRTANYSQTYDDAGTKPDDNATNSADPNSPFGAAGTVADALTRLAAAETAATGIPTDVEATLASIKAAARQGSPNLLLNGDFSDGLNHWTLSAPGAFAAFTYPSVGHYMSSAVATGNRYAFNDAPVVPGTDYSFSVEGDLYGGDGHGSDVYAKWVDGNGGDVSGPLEKLNLSPGWGRRYASATYVAPSNAAALRVVIEILDSVTQSDSSRYMVQQGPATDWRDDASQASTTQRTTALEGQDAAFVEEINTLVAQLAGTGDSGLKQSIATVSQTAQAGVDAKTAVAQLAGTTSAQFSGAAPSGLQQAITAAVQHTDSAISSEAGARAAAIAAITVTYNGQTISLQQLSAVLQTVDGNQTVIWQVTETLPDGTAKIALVNTKGGGSAFYVDAANAYFSGNIIAAGTVQTGALAALAVTNIIIGTDGAHQPGAVNGSYGSPGATITSTGGTLRIDYTTAMSKQNAGGMAYAVLTRDMNGQTQTYGSSQFNASPAGSNNNGQATGFIIESIPAGSTARYYLTYAYNTASGGLTWNYETIIVTEFKR